MTRYFTRFAIAVSLFLIYSGAQAAPIIRNINIEADQFGISGPGANTATPPSSSYLDVTIKFDPLSDIYGTQSGILSGDYNSGVGPGVLRYSYNSAYDQLFIGTNVSAGDAGCRSDTTGFCAVVGRLNVTTPGATVTPLLYSITAYSGALTYYGTYLKNSSLPYTIATLPPVAGVPEPATWGMMIVGLGIVGFAMRRRAKITELVPLLSDSKVAVS